MSGSRLPECLVSLSLVMSLASCDRARQQPAPAPAPSIGMEKPLPQIFKELTRLGFCAEKTGPVCYSRATGIRNIEINIVGTRIQSVEILIDLGFHHEASFINDANENANRLARYFLPPWTKRAEWIAGAVDNSRRAYCPKMTKVGPYFAMIGRMTPQSIPGAFEDFVFARPESARNKIEDFDYDHECNYTTGRFIKEVYNPPYLPYIW